MENSRGLFRSEVVSSREQRLFGDMILSQPVQVHLFTGALAAIVLLVVVWLATGSYTRSERALGMLVTDAPSAKVIASRPGRIVALSVRDGDHVVAGQKLGVVLVELNDESGGSAVAESLDALDQQRLLANQQAAIAGQRAVAEHSRLMATVNGLTSQRASVDQQIALQTEVVASGQQMLQGLSAVLERGYVSRVEYERRRQALLGAQQQLSQLRQQAASLASQERVARAEIARSGADTASAIASARTSAESFHQQRAQALASRAYVITAPITGTVTALQAAPGRAAEVATPLMTIVPDGSRLHAEIYAPTRAIGFVKPGQEVRLLYDAFPYQRFGSFSGRIARVSQTVLDPREIASPIKSEEPVYRIDVTVADQSVKAFGESLRLQPGMTLSANIILERRSFLDWLLQPLEAVMRRNG
jgi:membrane fusion protein